MPRSFVLLILLSSLFYFSCNTSSTVDQPFSFIQDVEAQALLSKAIAGSGGLENWQSVSDFKFRKVFSLFLENGEVESAADQQHHYDFSKAQQKINIKWENESGYHLLRQSNGEIVKTTDGQLDTTFAAQRAENIILSSTFVMLLPYNLIDSTAQISYGGEDKLLNGAAVEILQVTYDPAEHKNHSTPDIWWLYFAESNGALLGYMVKHADHYSYVENVETKKVNGLLMPLKRKSWRVDSLRNPLYLRADYAYSYQE